MKRIISVLAAAALLLLSSCSLEYTTSRYVTKDGVNYYTSSTRKTCFAGECVIGSDADELTIPDEVDGYRVAALGGITGRSGAPMPFIISLPGARYPCLKEDLPEGANVTEKDIVLRLGKNIETVNEVPMGYLYVEKMDEYVHLTVYVVCDGDNPYYYSEGGRLFERKSGELVETFEYSSEK